MTLRIQPPAFLAAVAVAVRPAFAVAARSVFAVVRPAFPTAVPLVFLAIASLVALAVLPLIAEAMANVPPPPVTVLTERAVVSHPAYWSRARMERAVVRGSGPATGATWQRGGTVARTTGRVFFTLNGVDYTCSGTTVGGPNPDVVVTAAHCVCDGAGAWAVNWTFAPGYDSGQQPYGSYPAKMFHVSRRWSDGADEDDDIAFVDVGQSSSSGVPNSVGDVVGSQPISFGSRPPTAAVFGYPAKPPYSGEHLDYCRGQVSPDPYGAADSGLPCAMTEGDSGGPWLSRFDAATGTGVITGITSFKYAGEDGTLYSANLGPVAKSLYTRAENS